MKAKLEVEMPEGCHDCQFCVGTECGAVDGMPTIDLFGEDDIRPKWCPLKPEETVETMYCYPKTGWIPVEERLPETNRTVLIFAESTTIQGGTIMLAGACNNGYWFVQNGQNTLGFPCSEYNIVAWMSLPEPYNPVN